MFQAFIYCIESCFFSITWGLHSLENTFESPEMAQKNSDELKQNLHKYMDACNNLIRFAAKPQIKEAVSDFILKTLRIQ